MNKPLLLVVTGTPASGKNMESINAVLIHNGLAQSERLIQLNKMAITQMKSLLQNSTVKKLR